MISALKALFISPTHEDPQQRESRLRLAAAALLIETARADFTQDASEQAALERLLTRSLSLEPADVKALIADAESRVDDATSLYEFTRVINDHYTAQQKLQLIDAMWAVAYADGNLDKYEEHLIRQVAELTYVPHADYIRSKLAAQP
ncbi:MAG: TerB family tellurite resistance protein [Halioglobus sp.]